MSNPTPPEALASLDSIEPVRIAREELSPASCLECHEGAWHWEQGLRSDGRAFLFDLVGIGNDLLLSRHDCRGELGPEELDDPDYGWVVG